MTTPARTDLQTAVAMLRDTHDRLSDIRDTLGALDSATKNLLTQTRDFIYAYEDRTAGPIDPHTTEHWLGEADNDKPESPSFS